MEPPNPFPHQTYERSPRWTAVDDYATTHLYPPTAPLHAALAHATNLAHSRNLPDIAVSRLQGQFIALQCRMLNAKHVLEVGTLGGYSTICLAGSGEDVRVTTVEVDERHAAVAREAIDAAGAGERVEICLGAGMEVLPKLREEVEAGKRERWDFVFIDADKENNLAYLNEAVPMCRSRACVIVDNVVRKGNVADAEMAKTDSRVEGSRRVIEAAGRDERLDCSLLQTVGEKNYDGMLICVVK